MRLYYMARAELHLHLEGSIERETVRLLDPSLADDEIESAYRFEDFAGFLMCFRWISQRLRGPGDYAVITRRLLERLWEQEITYAEITLAAGVVLWKKQDLAGIWEAIREASARSPVEAKWNLDAIRHFGPEPAMQVAEFAAAHKDEGIVSIGIGGDEVRGPAEWFREMYCFARQHGLHLTAHAGEAAGPDSIWAALEIGAERIGHGIRAIDDPVLLRHLRDHQIPLEVSITSNVRTGAVASLDAHPLRGLFDAGVPLTLNTDDPAIFGTTLAKEFAIARNHFRFTESELTTLQENAWRFRFGRPE